METNKGCGNPRPELATSRPHAKWILRAQRRELKTCGVEELMSSNNSQAKSTECNVRFAKDPLTGGQIRIGIMGSADEGTEPTVVQLCRDLGRAVAESGCCLLTGACPGLPHGHGIGYEHVS